MTQPSRTQLSPRSSTDRRAVPGFTLVELLVVMSLITVLMGIGVGFLARRGDDLDIALAAVRDQVRAARISAVSRHAPTEVRIYPRTDDASAKIRARVLQPVGHWHMEQSTSLDDDPGSQTVVTGEVVPGRFGMARRHDFAGRLPILRVPIEGRAFWSLHDGFALRLDLRLEERAETAVASLGTGFRLMLDEHSVPTVRLVLTEGGERAGPVVNLQGQQQLELGVWHTLELIHTGSEILLQVDGVPVDREQASLPILQTGQDDFIVSDPDQPVFGVVDSVAVWAYAFAETQDLPGPVEIASERDLIAFDRDGNLVESVRFVLTSGEEEREYRIGPGGVVGEVLR